MTTAHATRMACAAPTRQTRRHLTRTIATATLACTLAACYADSTPAAGPPGQTSQQTSQQTRQQTRQQTPDTDSVCPADRPPLTITEGAPQHVGTTVTLVDGGCATRTAWVEAVSAAVAAAHHGQERPIHLTLADGTTLDVTLGSRLATRETWEEGPDGPHMRLHMRWDHRPNGSDARSSRGAATVRPGAGRPHDERGSRGALTPCDPRTCPGQNENRSYDLGGGQGSNVRFCTSIPPAMEYSTNGSLPVRSSAFCAPRSVSLQFTWSAATARAGNVLRRYQACGSRYRD